MNVKSPISSLRDVLAQVREVGVTYRAQLSGNEAGTRLALIDPVLTALGWNLANPMMVVVENTVQSVRADYVLYDSSSVPIMVVEAKHLSAKLAAATSQLSATTARVQANHKKCGFLTDGLKWEFYEQPNPLAGLNFAWTGDIEESDDLLKIAAHLIGHLDAALFWPEEKDTTAPEIVQLQQDNKALENRIIALEGGVVSPPPPVPTPQSWIEFDKLPDVTNTLPSQMRLPDGSVVNVRSWGQALVTACEYVLNSDPTTPIPFSDSARGTINLLSNVRPVVGRSQQIQTKSGSSIFVYVNYRANFCAKNINHIFKHILRKQTMEPAIVYASVGSI